MQCLRDDGDAEDEPCVQEGVDGVIAALQDGLLAMLLLTVFIQLVLP